MDIGLGFAGAGWLGESLIRELPLFPEFRLAAVQDVNAALAREVAARHGAAWAGAAFEDLLARPEVEAVAISTPNAFHAEQARAALAAGKHVLVQKPLALSADDARATVDAAQEAGKVLLVDYSYRYLATFEAALTAAARFGPVREVRGAFHNIYGPGKAWFFDPALSGGGALMDLGVHLVDLALHVLQPAGVRLDEASFVRDRGHAVEDAASLRIDCDGVPIAIDVSWQAEGSESDILLSVRAERATVTWRNVAGSFFHFRAEVNGLCLLDRETTLRADTLRAFRSALLAGGAKRPDVRVYRLLAEAYNQA
jgi:predicted dehydrogenase